MSKPPRTSTSRPFQGRIGRTIAGSEPWWPPRATPVRGAPNIVLILVDDMGFSDVGCFGSELDTPAIDSIAENGVRYVNFHATPLCSPTRASLLTGMDHHKAGFASVVMRDGGFPNRRWEFPPGVTTLPETLRGTGYATIAIGKWHLVPLQDANEAGSRVMWPLQRGFDRWFGFLEGFTNQHQPHVLCRDNSFVDVDEYPEGYYLTDDLTDQAIRMIKSVRANDPEKPFFLYFAHAAMHAPLMARQDDIGKHRGRYDVGWDEIRARRFRRQLELGLFPPGTRIAPRNQEEGLAAPPWDGLPADDRVLFARMMEVYAAMVEALERSTARMLGELEELGERENTLVLFMSDNGASGEGGPRGLSYFLRDFPSRPHDGVPPGGEQVDLGELGGPRLLMHYPSGWAMACNTPFRLYKAQLFEGGVRVPLIMSWPGRLGARREIRHGYQYVTDVMPTILDLLGVPLPGGLDGVSFARGDGTHERQHEEMRGSRSFYRSGWKAVTLHRRMTPIDDTEWQLYRLATDPTETDDLAAAEPKRVRDLAGEWERAALAKGVYPIDEGSGFAMTLSSPEDQRLAGPVTLLPGTPTLERSRSSMLIAGRSFTATVSFSCRAGDEGVLFAHGGQGGGYVVYVENGRLRLGWNEYGVLHEADGGPLEPGNHEAVLAVLACSGGRCDVSLGEARLANLRMFLFAAPLEGIDVGIDRRSPVSWPLYERHRGFRYPGAITSVRYVPGDLAEDAPARRAEALRAAGQRFE
jgi:arylsulfatase A-like enzyme